MALGIEQNVLKSFNNIYQYFSLYISQLKIQRTYIFLNSYVGKAIGNILIHGKTIFSIFFTSLHSAAIQQTFALLFDIFYDAHMRYGTCFWESKKPFPGHIEERQSISVLSSQKFSILEDNMGTSSQEKILSGSYGFRRWEK